MSTAIRASWVLFLGVALIMLGNGLQVTLLSVRAAMEGFSTAMTGLIMSGYFIGFLAGSVLAPKLVQNVGHIRVFAALASLASTAVLVHAVVIDPASWVAMRIVTGFSYAGLYVVAESWLNDRADNQTRGQLLAVYMIIVLGGMGSGQFLLNVIDPQGTALFIVASILVSLALIPMLLNAGPAPDFSAPARISLAELYRRSPLGVVGSFGTGLATGTVLGLAAVYAESIGLTIAQVTLFVGVIFLGGMLLQWPLGRISDTFDRRRVLTVVTLSAAVAAMSATLVTDVGLWPLFALTFLYGGLCLPMYSICIAHANDHLEPEQMVGASGTLYFVVGIGASLGPFGVASVMSLTGANSFFVSLAVIHAAIGVFAMYRMTRRAAPPVDEQGPSLLLAGQTSPIVTELATEAAIEDAAFDAADA